MKGLRFLLLLGLLLWGTPGASAEDPALESGALPFPPASAPLSDEQEVDRQTHEIARGLRCPVCQGLSVADSTADTALAMRARVEELVRLGYDRDQIEGWFVDRYGAWVQLEPPAAGRNLVLYVAPLLALGLGLGLGLASWWRSTRGGTPPSEPPAPTGDAPASVNPYRQRVLSQIEEP